MNETLLFDVSALFNSGVGKSVKYSFDAPVDFDDFKLSSTLKGELEIMRIEDGFNCKISKVDTSVELTCDRCLKKFNEDIHVKKDERQYYFNKPESIHDPNDIFLVNIKRQDIDLTEPLRQEIILHFPELPVCYKSCKGICPLCGIEKNTKNCDCKEELIEENKPLAALKSLIKKNNA